MSDQAKREKKSHANLKAAYPQQILKAKARNKRQSSKNLMVANHFNFLGKPLLGEKYVEGKRKKKKYSVLQRGCSLTHSARTPPAVHPGITIWVDKIEIEIGWGFI